MYVIRLKVKFKHLGTIMTHNNYCHYNQKATIVLKSKKKYKLINYTEYKKPLYFQLWLLTFRNNFFICLFIGNKINEFGWESCQFTCSKLYPSSIKKYDICNKRNVLSEKNWSKFDQIWSKSLVTSLYNMKRKVTKVTNVIALVLLYV